MKNKILLSIFAVSIGYSATITVCASGCTTTSFQTALNTANAGDIIELTANEVFEGHFKLPWKPGTATILVRTSAYASLPPMGTRVSPSNTLLFPKLQPSNTTDPLVFAVPEEHDLCTANISTDVITCPDGAFSEGEPISQFYYSGIPHTPFTTGGVIYYARNPSGNDFQISLTPNGALVDIGGTSTVPDWKWQTNRVGNNYRFQGIEFRKKPGTNAEFTLIALGRGQEYSRTGIPYNIWFDRSYIHGIRDEVGPNIALMLNGKTVTVSDSYVDAIIKEASETKAISFWIAPGPMTVVNNYLSSGSINLLTGGSSVPISGLISGDEGAMVFTGNLFSRPMWMKYQAGTGGAGAPVSVCSPGDKYLNISNGVMYECNGASSWVVAPSCSEGEYFRRTDVAQNCGSGACWSCNNSGIFTSYGFLRSFSYATKNLFEVKSMTNSVISGNIFEKNWVGSDQNGTAVWIPSQVSQGSVGNGQADGWVRGENIRFNKNIIRYSGKGFRIASEGSTVFGISNNRIQVNDILMYQIGLNTTYPSLTTTDADAMTFAGPCNYCSINHVTGSNTATGGRSVGFDTAPFSFPLLQNSITYLNLFGWLGDLGNPVSYYFGTGNIQNVISLDNLSQGTGSLGAWATNGNSINPATVLFTSSTNFNLLPTSPYSASCVSSCGYAGTDGKDLGADIYAVNTDTGGATNGTSWLGKSIRVVTGSTKAVVSYTADTVSACTIKLYNNIGRSTLNGDTDIAGEQTDARAGSITNGQSRQIALGTFSALTANTTYWLTIDCSNESAVVPIVTTQAGASTVVTFTYANAITGNYSVNADMSSPTAIPSSTVHTIPINVGSILYYQASGGDIKIVTGR